MTELQIVQLLGIMYAALGIGLFLSGADYLRAVYADFAKHPGFMLFGGMTSAAAGFAMVVHYTTFDSLIPAIAAVVGWAALVKGVLILIFPAAFEALCRIMVTKTKALNYCGFFILAIGAVFAGAGL